MNRKATLDAALVFYNMLAEGHFLAGDDQDLNDRYEASLQEALKKAQENLAQFRSARAARMALDAVLPGWKSVDVSRHLKRELWHAFVSNDRDEWVEWLLAQGVPQAEVEVSIKRDFLGERS